MSEISTRLRGFADTDMPLDTLEVVMAAAEEIERLEHNQMSTDYANLARITALQTQEADARGRYAKKLEQKCEQLTDALTKAIGLQDALLTEMGDMQQQLGRPPNLQLLSAKRNFDAAMHTLLGDDEPDAD